MGQDLAAVLPLGDNQYDCGGLSAYLGAYDPTWGRVKAVSHPVPGNHEYKTPAQAPAGTDCDPSGQAAGYFSYFGAAAGQPGKGYYSFDVGGWHLIALNSNCAQAGGCEAGSAQEQWLRADLAAHPAECTLAYWHHPRFSSGATHGSQAFMAPIWQALYEGGADVVLSGHEHNYERFAPQTASGELDTARGLREFVVGTGGKSHNYPFQATPIANSEIRNDSTFGVLELTLHDRSYDWKFVPEAGHTFTDAGSAACH